MSLDDIVTVIKYQNYPRIAICPEVPVMIPGITAADALDANDCMGLIVVLKVPKSGIIQSALLVDPDDEGLQIDLEIFKAPIAQVANDAAFAPTDDESFNFVTEINFDTYNDHGVFQTAEVKNIGTAYNAPNGKFFIQAVTRGAHNIAAGASPRYQLQILSTDPDWK